jgi:hypothetical protein
MVMDRLKVSVAARSRLAGLLVIVMSLVVAACKGGGSSGY